MRYLDRQGQPITRELWWTYTLNENYCTLGRRKANGTGLEVEVAWVGVAFDHETERPGIFIVHLVGSDPTKVRETEQDHPPLFLPTAQEAFASQRRMIHRLTAKGGVG